MFIRNEVYSNYQLPITHYQYIKMKELPNYQILSTIYESANSIVYRGIKKDNHQNVILKMLKEDYPSPAELTRYRQEYEMISRLAHLDGIIGTCSIEKYQNTVMICLEDFGAQSLKKWMSEHTLTLEDFLTLAISATNILGQIHQQHIIHKDINPANLVFNPTTGILKVIDFGISTQLSRQHLTLKNPNVLEGTLAYMSPEQTGRMNRALDYRTDFYSLGVTFYELLTKQLPFQMTDAMELIHHQIAKQPVPPLQLNPEIPQAISDIIMKLLAKTAEDRYQSAWGIKADLEECKNRLAQSQHELFILAQHDISERFQIPQKLYGRESEINTLWQAFERVANPTQSPVIQSEIMLVTGYPGIGKSLLVKEIYKSLAEKKGYFISGKFDQFQRNIPYSAIVNAFRELVQQLLTESDVQLQDWKEQLLTALGPNGQVIIDVIPEIQLIIGPQPPVPILGATESQNRFNIVFQDFMRVFCQPTHPLVLFLDDLQWTDSATLNLLEVVLTDQETKALFFIGAYRKNEVDSTHPLVMTLDTLRQENLLINQINLTPLTFEHINQLIADSLHQSAKQVASLTDLVMRKTGGNPFFVTQFLHTLYEEELLTFNAAERLKTSKELGWQWNIESIEALDITDNVVDLMIGKLKKLPDSAQHVLRLAACVGNHFNLEMLSLIAETSPAETFQHLEPVIMEGLILPLSEPEINQPPPYEGEKVISDSPITISHFRFLHDRVQQAAYALIDEEHKKALHLQIGRLLLNNTGAYKLEKNLFDIVEHFNLGRELINNSLEKTELARLNLKAGQKAKAATAYGVAAQYLNLGLSYLVKESWETEYELTLNLHVEAMEAEYLNSHYEQTEKLAEIALQKAKTMLNKIKVYEIQIQTNLAQNQLHQAIQLALSTLNTLGVQFPNKIISSDIATALQKTESLLTGKSINDLLHLPEMTDPIKLAIMRIILKVIRPAQYSSPELLLLFILEQVNTSIQYGNAPESILSYTYYAFILCQKMDKIDIGYQFAQLGLNLLNQLEEPQNKTHSMIQNSIFKSATLFLNSMIVTHWKKHIRQTLQPFLKAYQTGLETGEISFASNSALGFCFYLYFSGEPLDKVEQNMGSYGKIIAKFKQEVHLNFHRIFHQTVLNLLKPSKNPSLLQGNFYNEVETLPVYIQGQNKTGLYLLYLNKLILSYLFQNEAQLSDCLIQVEKYVDIASGIIFTIFHFYHSLTILTKFSGLSDINKQDALKKIFDNQNKLQTWADYAPMNYLHKYHLVEAEKARVLGQFLEAETFYEKAIQGARDNEYLQEEALAYELAAKFYLGRGMEKFAQTYFREAHYVYQQWGATAKVTDLEERYPQFLVRQTSSVFESNVTHVSITRIAPPKSTDSDSQWLDLNTMMKASQALSGEIVLSQLLEKMMNIVIENAGAEKGFLLLPKGNNWFIEAEGYVDSKDIKVLQSILVNGPEVPLVKGGVREVLIPSNIIYYVVRAQESIVLHDATQEGIFTRDPYIVNQKPKSVLAMPLITQGKLTGILYLENNLTTGAFTTDRLEVLKLLSSQMAISIENAKLYTKVRDNENRLRQFLEAIPIGVFVVDKKGQPYFVNQTGQQILGQGIIPEANAENLPEVYQAYLRGTDQIYPIERQPVVRALQGEKTMIDDMEIRQNEQRIPLEVWGRPIFDEQENMSYAIATFQDISERLQREKAERKREAAEAVNKAIMESIQYAKLIQSSLLPNLEQIKTYLPNSFFLWMPRDIVGGDMFYTEAFEDGFIVAVMDCTGHGVPGAFMTMIATTSLKRIIKDEGCHEPSEILKRLNFSVKTALQQETEYARSDDGLDAAICWIKPQENILSFAGAKLPLYYIQHNQFTVIKGDKQSLGYKKSDLNFVFTSHTVPIETGMSFYLSTDGFLDQLGGPKRFSFGKKRFQKLLLGIEHHSFDEQAEKLLDAFNHYKGDNNRQDDVTVVGFGF
jgi:PAS domain S-box-containing protein